MRARPPTPGEIEELVAFLPRLYAEGFVPVRKWHGGTKREDGIFTMPWPEYDELVVEFFRVAAGEGWVDYDYRPEEASAMLMDNEVVSNAGLAQIRTMLTFCLRGERFSDGHWGEMIAGGHIRRLLERLAELGRESDSAVT
jgi:hypothetical protein